MSADVLRKLIIGFVVVVFLWGAAEILRGGGESPAEFRVVQAPSDAITRIELISDTGTIALESTPAGWTVNGYDASPDAVTLMVSGLVDTTLTAQLVAMSPSSHERTGVDSASADRLIVGGAGGQLAAWFIGNQGEDFRSVHMRRVGENDVYLVRGAIATDVRRELDEFRDRRVTMVDPAAVIQWSVERGGRLDYRIEKRGSNWRLQNGAVADSAAVLAALARFRTLTATGFATAAEAESADFGSPDLAAVLTGATGDTLAFLALDSLASWYVVSRSGSRNIWRLSSTQVNQLFPPESTFE